jgi:acyl dehydratase
MAEEFWRQNVEVEITVTVQDFLEFAALTGDDAAHHLEKSVANAMGYDDCVSQGLLVLSLSGKASSEYLRAISRNGVTYGYNNLRFPAPVYAGEKLTITYVPESINEKNVISSKITVKTSSGDVAVAGTHLLKILD